MTLAMDIRAFAEKAGKNANQKVQKICLDLVSGIVLKTPVDTGRARANWQTSIGNPLNSTIETTDPGGGKTISAAISDTSKASGNIFWITNNLPYIYRLEYEGWSKQAPRGMARLTIEEVRRQLR
jgi:hypothetical protein